MDTVELVLFSLLTIQLFQKELCEVCPSPALWQIVAKETCRNISWYHCALDSATHEYKQKCLQPVEQPAGGSIILANTYLIVDVCRNNRYQPRKFWSYEHNKCVYKKSLCSEEGQLIYSNGTSIVDRSCHCDYTKGYVFAKPPRHQCYCVPSREDCGCILKQCPNTRYVLSQEYQCVLKDLKSSSYKCRSVTPSSVSYNNRKTYPRRITGYDDTKYNIEFTKASKVIPTILIGITIFLAVMCIGVILLRKGHTDERHVIHLETIKFLTEKTIKQATKDPTFVITHGYKKAQSALDELGITILKGRYGTGKSTMAIHLASHYVDKGHEPYKFEGVDITHLKHLMRTKKKCVVILENIIGDLLLKTSDLVDWKQVMKVLFLFKSNTKIIITTYCVNRELWELLTQNIRKSEKAIINLDENELLPYDDDKVSILRKHSQKHNIEDIEDFIHECCKCNTVIGFPLMCSLFYSDKNNVTMGVRYFEQFPSAFVERIEKFKDCGIDNDFEGMKYTVLVYIAIHQENNYFVSVSKNDIKFNQFKTIFRQVYNRDYTLNVTSIQNSANGFRGQYLDVNDVDEFSFTHHGIKQAFLITFGKIDPVCIIESVFLEDLLAITRPAKYKRFPSESWFDISPKDSSDVYVLFSKRIVQEYCYRIGSAKEIDSYLKQYVVNSSDWVLLESVFNVLNRETQTMTKQDYIPKLITIFQEITNGSKLCLPIQLEPIGFRLTWEMICAAKNDEKEMFAKLVQIATEVKNLPDNFIYSIIDDENHSLLHYLVVWGYDAGIQLLETESTLETTLTNKRNFTPVHFSAYLGRHTFLELLLKKTGNVERSKLLQIIKKIFQGEAEEGAQKKNLIGLLEYGEKKAEQDIPLNEFYFNVNEHLVSSLACGTKSQYEESRRVIENIFKKKFPSTKQSEIRGNHEKAEEATEDFGAQK